MASSVSEDDNMAHWKCTALALANLKIFDTPAQAMDAIIELNGRSIPQAEIDVDDDQGGSYFPIMSRICNARGYHIQLKHEKQLSKFESYLIIGFLNTRYKRANKWHRIDVNRVKGSEGGIPGTPRQHSTVVRDGKVLDHPAWILYGSMPLACLHAKCKGKPAGFMREVCKVYSVTRVDQKDGEAITSYTKQNEDEDEMLHCEVEPVDEQQSEEIPAKNRKRKTFDDSPNVFWRLKLKRCKIIPNYVGESKFGIRDGHGIYTYPDGSVYNGGWYQGEKHGDGTLIYNDGSIYTGMWKGGQRHGSGTYARYMGCTYSGGWQDGKRHGYGIHYPYGCVQQSGLWKYTKGGTADSTIYEGQWTNSKKHGKGIVTYYNGATYRGEWNRDVNHGSGILIHSDGSTYEGTWDGARRAKYMHDHKNKNK